MASKLFLVDLDLNLNKAKNFRLEDFSTDPSTSLESGRLVYFTGIGVNQNHFKAYNGTAWKTLAYTDDVPDIEISLEAATGFTVSGSPADASGTLTFEWDEVAPGYVLAGALDANTSPAPGNAIPTFRALGEQDIPVEIARVEDVNTSLEDYILLTEKGEALGVAELNASGVVPSNQLYLGSYSGDVSLTASEFDTVISLNALTTGSSISLAANTDINLTAYDGDVVINSFSGGEYLGSVDPNNQIATIGDINSEGVNLLTGTENQIAVSGDGTGDVTISLTDDVTLPGKLTFTGDLTEDFAGSIEIQQQGMGGNVFLNELKISTTDYNGDTPPNIGRITIDSEYVKVNSDYFVIDARYNVVLNPYDSVASTYGKAYLYTPNPDNEIIIRSDIEALDAYDITSTQISNWDTAYGWGDHSTEGYLTTAVESISNVDGNITFSTSTGSVTADLATDVEISGDLIVQGDLTVNGDVTTLNTATMNVEDNIFVLNSNVTGTPSVDAGIEVERGTSTNASLIWSESNDVWQAGLLGSEKTIARKFVTTTTGTTHTITHGLATSDVTVNCWLDGSQVEAAIVVTDTNTVTVTTNSSITNLKTVVVG
jgi:hypothetical protein